VIDAVWWSVPEWLVGEVLVGDWPSWTVCASCIAAFTQAAI
jgi:hypothetical protein